MAKSSSEPTTQPLASVLIFCLQSHSIHYIILYCLWRQCPLLSIKGTGNSNITLYAEVVLERLFVGIFPRNYKVSYISISLDNQLKKDGLQCRNGIKPSTQMFFKGGCAITLPEHTHSCFPPHHENHCHNKPKLLLRMVHIPLFVGGRNLSSVLGMSIQCMTKYRISILDYICIGLNIWDWFHLFQLKSQKRRMPVMKISSLPQISPPSYPFTSSLTKFFQLLPLVFSSIISKYYVNNHIYSFFFYFKYYSLISCCGRWGLAFLSPFSPNTNMIPLPHLTNKSFIVLT